MKRIGTFIFSLGLMILCAAVVYAGESEYTEGDLVYVIDDGGIIITGYFGSDSIVVIPREIAGLPVSEISEGAFMDSSVTKLILPQSIMKISEQAIPPNCQVEYEVSTQSAQEEESVDDHGESAGNNMTGNSSIEADTVDMSQMESKQDTNSTSVQEKKKSGQDNNSAKETSTQKNSTNETGGSKNVGTEHDIVDNTTRNASEANSGRASIDESEIELEENLEESKMQDVSSRGSKDLQSASENELSNMSNSVAEENKSDSQVAAHKVNRSNVVIAGVVIIIILAMIISKSIINKKKKT